MADPIQSESRRLPTASAPEFIATFAAILVAIVALLAIDTWLARIDREESRSHAANLYADGRALLARHDAREASERFASAAAIERSNVAYQLGMAEAMLADHRVQEAQTTLEAVLDRAETDGAANLLMAHVLRTQGRIEEAKSYFHRAIYGRWRGDTVSQRMQVRFELIDVLERAGMNQELLAELLPIQDAFPDSQEFRRKLGHLFLDAGSPERAVVLFRPMLRASPNDGDAYAGMGEAALMLGNFQTARADLGIAARLLPRDTAVRSLLEVADTALALDPLQRGLDQRAREERGRALLAATIAESERCAQRHGGQPETLLDSARHLLVPAPNGKATATTSDVEVAMATSLWARIQPCPAGRTVTGRSLEMVQAKLRS
jgi:tetratricopeptide (TPR) repeat protein